MKVVAFIGSPRADGTTDALVRQVLNGAEDKGADTAIFHIGLLNINGCHACMKCRKTGICVQDDDMKPLFDEIRNSDCIVLGTPIYFYYMTAQLKAFTDRLFSLVGDNYEPRIAEKKTVFVVTQGADDPAIFKSQIDSMISAWGIAGLNVTETIHACAISDIEQLEEDEELMEKAFTAGQNLID